MGLISKASLPFGKAGKGKGSCGKTVVLAGNPNVGKSTLFNALTGLKQHTGNWSGKTVAEAVGSCIRGEAEGCVLRDIPGSYSLTALSEEEAVAAEGICFDDYTAAVTVCDASCLEKNLVLALQVAEMSDKTLVCVNLLDEAEKKGIFPRLRLLEERLGLSVVGISAREPKDIRRFSQALASVCERDGSDGFTLKYPEQLEELIAALSESARSLGADSMTARRTALLALRGITARRPNRYDAYLNAPEFKETLKGVRLKAESEGLTEQKIADTMAFTAVVTAEELCRGIIEGGCAYSRTDKKADGLLTGRSTAFPIMLAMLLLLLWLTAVGANYPSELLSRLLLGAEKPLSELLYALGASDFTVGLLVYGAYRTLAWVVSVMLPPMAVFFPLFTLLEDVGVLPRIAYNLDRPFASCRACGKQALTMCMGLGCNAAGITGCRIIDSPRERLLGILTNSLVPCNGRFPMLITLSAMLAGGPSAFGGSFVTAAVLTAAILLSVVMTLALTRLLSLVLRGKPSPLVLEMPSYRRPQLGKILLRSFLDRTIFVLGRAAAVAAPAGALIWLAANIDTADGNLLTSAAGLLEPLGRAIGLDGVILLAFLLGLPANEIVLPIAVMIYSSSGAIEAGLGAEGITELLSANGWTRLTAVCVMLFSLFHWPCSTSLLTVKRETGSIKHMLLAALLPTAVGILLCGAVNLLFGVI